MSLQLLSAVALETYGSVAFIKAFLEALGKRSAVSLMKYHSPDSLNQADQLSA